MELQRIQQSMLLHTHRMSEQRTISLIPVSFPVGSLGLEEGRGGGTRAPAVNGVAGLFGAGTTHRHRQMRSLVRGGWKIIFFHSKIVLNHLANLQQKTLFSRSNEATGFCFKGRCYPLRQLEASLLV